MKFMLTSIVNELLKPRGHTPIDDIDRDQFE